MSSAQSHELSAKSLVSVIIPTFNRKRFLPQALESAFAQDYRPIEVIVVDDGSTDGTLELLHARGDVICVPQPHRGVAAARNAGGAVSQGRILAFLDSDDLWPTGRLRIIVTYFEEHPEIGYILGKEMHFVEPGYETPPWAKPEWLAVPRDGASTGVLVVRRETWLRVGEFNSEFVAGEDTEWLIRAREAAIPMGRLPDVLVHARLHGDNLSVWAFKDRKRTWARLLRDAIRRRNALDIQ